MELKLWACQRRIFTARSGLCLFWLQVGHLVRTALREMQRDSLRLHGSLLLCSCVLPFVQRGAVYKKANALPGAGRLAARAVKGAGFAFIGAKLRPETLVVSPVGGEVVSHRKWTGHKGIVGQARAPCLALRICSVPSIAPIFLCASASVALLRASLYFYCV